MEDEYETTYTKQDDGTTHMKKGVLVLTDAQHKALQIHGIAWHYDDAAWSQNGTEGSIYQNVNLPEGPVQLELLPSGRLLKHDITKSRQALARRIMATLHEWDMNEVLTKVANEDLTFEHKCLALIEVVCKEALE